MAPPSAAIGTPTPASSPTAGPTADPAVAAAALRLGAVLDTLAAGYRFKTTVTVADTVATTATGRWTQGASEFEVTASGAAVTYRSVPPGAWVQQANGTWTKLDGTAPVNDPVATLRAPQGLVILSDTGSALELTASYPAAALGAAGEATAEVRLVIGSDSSLQLTFSTVVDAATGATGTASSKLVPAPGQEPITAP